MIKCRAQSESCLRPKGFTLVEVIVVVVIIALLAAIVVPRFAGNDQRRFKYAVEQIEDLLTMYAQRENLGQKVVGLLHDTDDNSLKLMTFDRSDAGFSGNWEMDRYVAPVRFPAFMDDADIEIRVDGDLIDASEWPVSNEIGMDRPTLEVSLMGAGQRAKLTLQPHSVSPTLTSSFANIGTVRTRVDLDGTGRSWEDW